jgi:hypothetical protein
MMAGRVFELWGECAVSGREASGAHNANVGGEGNVSEWYEGKSESESEENGLGTFCAHGGRLRWR